MDKYRELYHDESKDHEAIFGTKYRLSDLWQVDEYGSVLAYCEIAEKMSYGKTFILSDDTEEIFKVQEFIRSNKNEYIRKYEYWRLIYLTILTQLSHTLRGAKWAPVMYKWQEYNRDFFFNIFRENCYIDHLSTGLSIPDFAFPEEDVQKRLHEECKKKRDPLRRTFRAKAVDKFLLQ